MYNNKNEEKLILVVKGVRPLHSQYYSARTSLAGVDYESGTKRKTLF